MEGQSVLVIGAVDGRQAVELLDRAQGLVASLRRRNPGVDRPQVHAFLQPGFHERVGDLAAALLSARPVVLRTDAQDATASWVGGHPGVSQFSIKVPVSWRRAETKAGRSQPDATVDAVGRLAAEGVMARRLRRVSVWVRSLQRGPLRYVRQAAEPRSSSENPSGLNRQHFSKASHGEFERKGQSG